MSTGAPPNILGRAERWRGPSTIAVLIALVGGVCVVGSSISPAIRYDTITMLINLVVVVGLYAFSGNTGILSFGHASFMAIGAYTAAILTIPVTRKEFLIPSLPGPLLHADLSPIPTALACGAAAAVFAAAVSVPIMRLTGLAASLGMFAILLTVHVVVGNWESVTRGVYGIFGVPTNTTVLSAFAWACLAIIATYLFQRSSIGLRLRAARDNAVAARAVGMNIPRDRRIALVFSAFWVGLGGFLFAQLIGAFGPDDIYFEITFLTIAMLVIGGIHSLSGAVVGVVSVSILSEGLRNVEDGLSLGPVSIPSRPGTSAVGLGLVMIVILVFRPEGLMGGRELGLPGGHRRLRRRQRDPVAGAAPEGTP